MRGMHRLVGLAGMALCVAAVAPATADASQTIGQTGLDGGGCTNRAFVQHDVAAGPSYSPSSSGLITSWGAQANASPDQTLQLAVFSQSGDLDYTILRRDSVRTLANLNAVNTFTDLHLPIEAGQLIGVYEPEDSNADCEFDATGDDNVAFSEIGDISDNVPATYNAFDTGFRVNAQAVVEPDADHDGFGDETQDQCPANAATQGSCPVTPATRKCKHKKKKHKTAVTAKKCKKHKKKHH
jgi:hypothetical protein